MLDAIFFSVLIVLIATVALKIWLSVDESSPVSSDSWDVKNPYFNRVKRFWNRFIKREKQFSLYIDYGKMDSVQDMLAQMVEKLLPGLTFDVMKDDASGVYQFYINPGEDIAQKMLVSYWRQRAPKIDGWQFTENRPVIKIDRALYTADNGVEFHARDFKIDTHEDEKRNKLNISVFHHYFETLQEVEIKKILYFFFDIITREYEQSHIGKLSILDAPPENPINFIQFKWYYYKKYQSERIKEDTISAPDIYNYNPDEKKRYLPREDIVSGRIVSNEIMEELLNDESSLKRTIRKNGADFVYIMIENTLLGQENIEVKREELENTIKKKLQKRGYLNFLGGAIGRKYSYIDLMIFQGQMSIEAIRKVVSDEYGSRRWKIKRF